jgi:hypothetical protein
MLELLRTIRDTPLPLVLVIGGMIFLFVSFVRAIRSRDLGIEIANPRAAGILGFVLLVIGIGLFLVPSRTTASTPPTAISATVIPATTFVQPTALPTTTIPPTAETDTSVYDDFNDPRFDGSFDSGKWYMAASDGKVSQQAGNLTFEVDTTKGNNISLQALPYREKYFESPTFFEAKLMVPKEQSGHVYILIISLPNPLRIETDCIAGGSFGAAFGCGFHYDGTSFEDYSHSIEGYGEWHTVRMEIDPTTSTITYYVDGEEIKSLVANKLKEQRLSFEVGFFSEEPNQIYTGYVDDVRIGQLQ